MKIGELAKLSGLSTHTIRYYERIGLLPVADRDAGGRRDYDEKILVWIAFIDRLRTTGMPISEMVYYAKLRAEGSHTNPERRALLEQHREIVRAHLSDLKSCLLVLDNKIDTYVETEKGHNSNDNKDELSNRNKIGTGPACS